MDVRHYALVSDSAIDAIERKLDAVLAAWCIDWGVEKEALSLKCKRAWECANLPWSAEWRQYEHSGGAGSIWLCGQAKAVEALQAKMFPSDGRYSGSSAQLQTSLAAEASSSAMDALTGKIIDALGGVQTATNGEARRPDERLGKHASGAVTVAIRIGNAVLTTILDDACLRQNVPAHTFPASDALRMTKRGGLLGNVPITLQVELGKVQVEAGSLLMLSPGDVIRLDSAVDQPLPIFNSERQAMFAGYLGASGKSMVLEVTSKP